MSEIRPTQIGPVPVDENGIDLLDKALEISSAESRRWSDQHAILVDRYNALSGDFERLKASLTDIVQSVVGVSATARALQEKLRRGPDTNEERSLLADLLRDARGEDITVEVMHAYVGARVAGRTPAHAMSITRRMWGI